MEKTLLLFLLVPFFMVFIGVGHIDKKDCEEMGLDFYGFIKATQYNVDYGCYENGLKISYTPRYNELRAQYMQNKLNKK